MTVTVAQLRDRARLRSAFLAEITLLNSGPTLYLADRTLPGSISDQIYEHYIEKIDGLTEEVKRNDSTFLNSRITMFFLNDKYAGYNYLSEADATYPFAGAGVTIKEVLIDDDGTMATPTTVFKGVLDQPEDMDLMAFRCQVSSRLYAKARQFRQAMVDNITFPDADPDDLNKYLNIVYGSCERVRCHAVSAGATSTLTADMTDVYPADSGTMELSDASAFPSSDAFVIQIDDEQIHIASRSGNTLTLASDGRAYASTTATAHTKGGAAFEVQTEYVYVAAGHPAKAITDCYVDGVRQTAGYTAYTGQSGDEHADYPGMAVIAFSAKPKVMKQVNLDIENPSHNHAPTGSYTTASGQATLASLPQYYEEEVDYYGFTTSTSGTVNFTAVTGIIESTFDFTFTKWGTGYVGHNAYIKIAGVKVWETDASGAVILDRSGIALSATIGSSWQNNYLPVEVNCGDWTSSYPRSLGCYITACTRDVTYTSTMSVEPSTQLTALVGSSSADVVIGRSINVDMQGYQDTAGGTYTGTGSALIERPDHVMKHCLIAQLGYVSGDIDSSSFGTAGTSFGSAITGGYKFGFCISEKIDWPQLLQRLGFESRSNLYERAGTWYLKYLPDTAPAAVKTITQAELAGTYAKFLFNQSKLIDLKTMLDARFKQNYDTMAGPLSDWLGTSSTYKTAGTSGGGISSIGETEILINGALTQRANNIVINSGMTDITDMIVNGNFGTTNKNAVNPTLTATDKVTNGAFSTVTDIAVNGVFTDDTGWTWGSGWFWTASANARKGLDGTAVLENSAVIEAGKSYRVTYTISSYVSGTCTISLGGDTGTARSANGTYSETMNATTTEALKFTPTSTARFYIDTVLIEEFSWDMGIGWNLVSNVARKDEDGTGVLQQDFTTVIGKSYTVIFTVSSATVGSVTASIGGQTGTARSTNATFTETFTATTTDPLRFTPTNTSRLYVDSIYCYENSWVMGAGWNATSTTIKKDVAGTGTLSQDFGIVAGRDYTVTFTLSSVTTPNITPSIGGTNGTARTAAGTFTEVIRATNTDPFKLTPNDATRCTVDNIYISDAWQYGSGWSTNGSQGLHSADGTGALEQDFGIVAGKSYTLKFSVGSYTAGSVTPSIGGVTGTAISANGTNYTETFTAVNTDPLRFTCTNTARLVVDTVYCYENSWVYGTGWRGDSSVVLYKDRDGTGVLTQNHTAPIVAGKKYYVTFGIGGYSAGSVTPSIGGTDGTTRSAAGTYSEVITATNTDNLKLTPTNTSRFNVDNIYVETDWMYGSGWSYSSGAYHSGGTGALEQELTIEAGKSYKVTYTLAGYASGEAMYFTLGGVTSTPRANNGTFTETLQATNADGLKFYALNSADSLTVTALSVKELDAAAGGGSLGSGSDPSSIYGNYLDNTIEFRYIRSQAMADHVLAHILKQKNKLLLICRFPIYWEHFDLGVGDTFDISNALCNAKKFYIERFRRIDAGSAEVTAIEWW